MANPQNMVMQPNNYGYSNWNNNVASYQSPSYYMMQQNPSLAMSSNGYQTQNQNNQSRPSYIPGRVVNSEDNITPNEVPMDGNVAIFPQSDGNCIYAKWWGKNGLIESRTYTPVIENVVGGVNGEPIAPSDLQQQILERLDKIEKSLNRNYRPYNKPRPNNRDNVKKEENTNV